LLLLGTAERVRAVPTLLYAMAGRQALVSKAPPAVVVSGSQRLPCENGPTYRLATSREGHRSS
jgi:hypothetical protein